MKRWMVMVGLLVVAALYLLLWPVAIDPIAWEPPVHEPTRWQPTGTVAQAERVTTPGAHGPEDVEVDARGRIYAGVDDGRILVFDPLSQPPRSLASTGGRPLGMHFAKDGRLIIADAEKGMLAIDPSGKITVVTTTCAGTRMVFTDDVDIGNDGTIYFSDASTKYGQKRWKEDLMESRPNGRVCSWDPKTHQTTELMRDLYFANGVALDPEQQFLLVNETSRYRVRKLWIAGEKKGQSEIVIDNLPGFPDNISTGTGGVFWIAIASPRNPVLDATAGSPFLRKVIMRLPEALQPKPEKTARTIGIDEDGNVVADLFDPAGEKVFMVTSVSERRGQLYFGSLQDHAFAVMPRP
jgi:sugar lactone lactonase YvrE